MSYLIITVGSITNALRLEKKINSIGIINTAVIHTPSQINSGGCSYSVRVPYKYFDAVGQLISDKKIKYKKLYLEEADGESVWRDLSW